LYADYVVESLRR